MYEWTPLAPSLPQGLDSSPQPTATAVPPATSVNPVSPFPCSLGWQTIWTSRLLPPTCAHLQLSNDHTVRCLSADQPSTWTAGSLGTGTSSHVSVSTTEYRVGTQEMLLKSSSSIC